MNSGKVYALIQARMSSVRFPGKVVQELGGKPMIIFQVERILKSRFIDDLFVLTSTDSTDDSLSKILLDYGVKVFRGDLLNVNARFLSFLQNNKQCQVFVRLTADCPLVCSDIIDNSVKVLKENDLDYVSNTLFPTFPDGTDVEVVNRKAFLKLAEINLNEYQAEHVTPFLYQNPHIFKLGNILNTSNASCFRCTVDTKEDFSTIIKFLNTTPEISRDSRYSILELGIHSPNNPLMLTEFRKAITQGPWRDYAFKYDS
jgi:spore coat polysaccharide biosynthesis protein SpsF